MTTAAVRVRLISCNGAADRREAYPPAPGFELVLARYGAHGIHGSRGTVLSTPGTCFFGAPGDQEVDLSHPLGRGQPHGATVISFEPGLWAAAGGDRMPLPTDVQADASVELAHRRLLSLVRQRAPEELAAELVFDMVARLLAASGAERRRTRSVAADAGRDLVHEALTMLHLDPDLTGDQLSAALYCSRYHLSRLLIQHTGRGLAAHRTRLRTRQVLDRLVEGHGSLADLAAATGFADQAHLTRTVRTHFGSTPSALREMLSAPPPERVASAGTDVTDTWWSHCHCAECHCLEC